MVWHEDGRAYLAPQQCLAFDTHQELLWAGGLSGHVASYFTNGHSRLHRYTQYRGHVPGPARELLVDNRGILSVGGSIKLANRRGLALWNVQSVVIHRSGNASDVLPSTTVPLTCRSLESVITLLVSEGDSWTSAAYTNAASSEIVVGGLNQLGAIQPDLISVNASTGTVLRRVPNPSPVSFVRRSALVCCGLADGRVSLRDPRTLRQEHTLIAHMNGLSGLETEGNNLFSIGYSIRHGVPIVDPLVKVFDVRTLRPVTSVSFTSLPAFIQPHPRNSNCLVIVSSQGQLQISDLSNPSAISFSNVEVDSYVTAMAMAPTGEGLAFSDADGLLHLWNTAEYGEEARYPRFVEPIELPEPPEPPRQVNWSSDTPLSMVGMPHYDQPLLSILPWSNYSSQYSPLGQPPRKLDPALLATLKTVDFVGYAVNPKTSKRNQAAPRGDSSQDSKRKMDVPLFRSEKEREQSQRRKQRKKSEPMATTDTEGEEEAAKAAMPKYYRKVEIKYSKFGVEDFDFAFYNKTPYSGLETHILNSYTNSVLQVLRFLRPIRKLAEGHIWTECPNETCFLCELGFLFKMLKDAGGINCQATNFSKAFGTSQQAAALGLMDNEESSSSHAAYSSLIQTFNRFLLESTSNESDSKEHNQAITAQRHQDQIPSAIAQLVGLPVRTATVCKSCGYSANREAITNVLDYVYPPKALSNEVPTRTDFAAIFQASISREAGTRFSCPQCRVTGAAKVRRELTGNFLPPVLAVNTAVHTSDHVDVWLDVKKKGEVKRFLKPRFSISATGQSVTALRDEAAFVPAGEVVYELKSMVVQIQTEDDPPHLVSIIKVPASDGDPSGWHIFNDFLVRPIGEDEALSFPATWKIPAILYYERIDSAEIIDYSVLQVRPDHSILTRDYSVSKHRRIQLNQHKLLSKEELPHRGSLISIDAEFVSLQQEEVEYRSTGVRKLIRPSRMALARVSVIRGEGEETGVPFIDDYIQVNEPIVDYLTEFSGIRPGDLDANKSHHTLVPSKVAYKKLRLLVDLGCIFIGHGLNKDFRIINIFVPPSQILDTVNIYHLPHRHRKISLRFLSWVVLHQDIQSSGSHDSIEDARTALQLYEKYCQLDAEQHWESTLEDIYREGGRLGWKVPGSSDVMQTSPAMAHRQDIVSHAPRSPSEGLPMTMNRLGLH